MQGKDLLKFVAKKFEFTSTQDKYIDVLSLLEAYDVDKQLLAYFCEADSYFSVKFDADELISVKYNARWAMWSFKFIDRPWIYISAFLIENQYSYEVSRAENSHIYNSSIK